MNNKESLASGNEMVELISRWQGRMYNLSHHMFGNEADSMDATQEIFVRVFREMPKSKKISNEKAWMYRLGAHVILNYMRANKNRKKREAIVGEKKSTENFEKTQEQKELHNCLQLQLEQLPAELRSAMVLHYYDGLSQVEVAEALAIPRTTVQKQLQKGVQKLKTGLETAGFAATLPMIEAAFRSSMPLSVPSQLNTALMSLAVKSAATGATVVSTLTAGGLIMSKKIVIAMAITIVLSTVSGIGIGTMFHSDLPEIDPDTNVNGENFPSEIKGLKNQVNDLSNQNQTLSSKTKKDQNEISRLQSDLVDSRSENQELVAALDEIKRNPPQGSAQSNPLDDLSEEEVDGLKKTLQWLRELNPEQYKNTKLKQLLTLPNVFFQNENFDNENLAHLKNLPRLVHLDFGGSSLTDKGLSYIKDVKRLKVLVLNETKVTSQGIQELAELQYLELLWIHDTIIDDEGYEAIGKMSKLKNLVAWNSKLTDKGLLALNNLKNLERLSLSYTDVSDEGVRVISNFSKLTYLDLDATKVTDAIFEQIGSLRNLEFLQVQSQKLVGTGLYHLSNLSKLRSLLIGNNSTEDQYLPDLYPLKSLRKIGLTLSPNISDGAITDLRQALPDAKIKH